MKIKELLDAVKKLNLPRDKYAIFGSATLAVRGLRESPNIDLIVTDELWKDLKEVNKPDDEGFIRFGQVKISNWWFAPTKKTIPVMISEAEDIKGFPFVKLEAVRGYKRLLKTDKDKNDVLLIDKFLNSTSENEPVSLGVSDYSKLIEKYIQETDSILGDSIISMILFGSSARGEAKGSSDLDIFTFYDDTKITRDMINDKLIKIIVNLRKTNEYQELLGKNIYPEIYPFLISKSNSKNYLWVFFDATEQGIILKDTESFASDLVEDLKKKIDKLGGRRVKLSNSKQCWVLYKDFSQVLNKQINI